MTFEESEQHVDTSFYDMPKAAQEVALNIIDLCINSDNPERYIVRELDTSEEFRDIINCRDFDVFPKQVDSVIRYYRWHYK